MKTNRPLGTKARERAAAERAERGTPPTVGHGDGPDDQAYRGVVPDASVTDLAGVDRMEADFRGTDRDPDIPRDSRLAVYARSSGGTGDPEDRQCEARASRRCSGRGTHLHHRKLRRHGDHRPINLLDVCAWCHHDIHAEPKKSYAAGYMVRSADDPAQAPLTMGVLVR